MKLLNNFLQKKVKSVNISDILKNMEYELKNAWDNEEKMEELYEKNFKIEWNGMKVVIPFGAGMYDAITKALKYMIADGCDDDVENLYRIKNIKHENGINYAD